MSYCLVLHFSIFIKIVIHFTNSNIFFPNLALLLIFSKLCANVDDIFYDTKKQICYLNYFLNDLWTSFQHTFIYSSVYSNALTCD